MNYENEFDMIDAFMALKDLDDDSVTSMVKNKSSNKGRKLHEGKGYPLHSSAEALSAAREFLNENDELALEVIDPDADTIEHIKDRIDYVGQMILRCNRCQANKFIDMEKLVENPEEEGVYNIDDECPNCKTSGVGYEIIGQVGKYEEPKAEEAEETETESNSEEESSDDTESEVSIENDSAEDDEVKFDNDEASESEDSEDSAEEQSDDQSDAVEFVDDSEEDEEPDMMETTSSEDDDLELPSLDDEEEEDEEVKESLYRAHLYEDADKAAKYQEEALMYDKIMSQMANDEVYAKYWEPIWKNYESNVSALTTNDIVDLADAFEDLYRKFHNDGLLAAESDVIKYCASLDKQYGLATIENHHMYTESVEVLNNTTISEVLGSILDADKVGKIEVTNTCDNKKAEKVYDGDYNNLPLNIANAACTGFDINNRTLACNVDQDENHGRRNLADILDKFADDKSDNIHLYDIASSDEIFKGKKSDAIKNFGQCGFISIDTPAVIRFTICDPSILSRHIDTEKGSEDTLVEHIIAENNLSITRLNAPYSNEFWISESIKDKEDLDVIYEAYVKPCSKELIAEFKKVTGYSNAVDEAFEAGYSAAKNENINESADTKTYEFFIATCYADSDENIANEDFATVTIHPDGLITVEGDLMFSDGKDNIVDALVDAAQSIHPHVYAGVEFMISDELDAIVTPEQKAEIAERLGYVVEELEADNASDVLDECNTDTAVDEAFVSRDQLIADLRKLGKNYYFDKYTDAQLYMMLQKAQAKAATPNKSLSRKDDELITACEKCGARLNDSGTCPSCDDGEEDLNERFDFNALYDDVVAASGSEEATNEGILRDTLGNYFFNTELANELYDEFYRPLTDAIRSGDKEAAQAIYDEFKADYDSTPRRKFGRIFYEVQDKRFMQYQAQIDAMKDPALVENADDDFADWVDEEPKAAEPQKDHLEAEALKQAVENEMPFAIKEWGRSLTKLTNHFLTLFEESLFEIPNVSELQALITAYLDANGEEIAEAIQSFKSRKDLAAAITECKNNSKPYTVRRSVKEGYRYDLVLHEDDESDEFISDDELKAHDDKLKSRSKDNKEETSKDSGEEVMDKLSDASSYTEFVKILNKDRKSKAFLQYLRQHYNPNDDEIKTVKASGASTALAKCSTLIPTQQNISLDKSLGMIKPGKSGWAVNIINDPTTAFDDPTITYAGKYIIDGHHRWSKAYALVGPDAKIKVINFPEISGVTWKDMLKATQLAIVAKKPEGDLIHKVDNDNMLEDTSGQAAANYYNEHADDKVVDAMKAKGFGDDKEAQSEHVKANVAAMASKGVVSGAAPRAVMPQTDTAPGSVELLKKAVIDLTEGDNLPAPVDSNSVEPVELTPFEIDINNEIMRISQDIANAINDRFNVDADPQLIVADILQDLGLISGDINVEDLPDTPANNMTREMYQSHEMFYAFMDELVSGLTGQSIRTTPEQKFKNALKMIKGPNFSTENIRKGINSPAFLQAVATGNVPFVPASATRGLLEEVEHEDEIDIRTERFDADMNEYFNEAYEDTLVYTTTSGTINPDGSILLEGVLMGEDTSTDVKFTLAPEKCLNEDLSTDSDIKATLESLDYTVTNNVSEEVFKFNFND